MSFSIIKIGRYKDRYLCKVTKEGRVLSYFLVRRIKKDSYKLSCSKCQVLKYIESCPYPSLVAENSRITKEYFGSNRERDRPNSMCFITLIKHENEKVDIYSYGNFDMDVIDIINDVSLFKVKLALYKL